jgi:hypothetical protein
MCSALHIPVVPVAISALAFAILKWIASGLPSMENVDNNIKVTHISFVGTKPSIIEWGKGKEYLKCFMILDSQCQKKIA